MATMLEIVNDALEELGVKTAELPITNDEFQSGLRRCNDMLTEWQDAGIIVGYNEVTNNTDELELDRNAIAAVKYNLAVRLAPSFDKIVTPALLGVAVSSFSRLEASSAYIGEVAYPDTLPMGSGNRHSNVDTDRRFFPNNKDDNF